MKRAAKTATLATRLAKLGACGEALDWVGRRRNAQAAWDDCPRGNWLLWLQGTCNADRRKLVKAAAACARLALPVWEQEHPADLRPRQAVEAAEAWARGEITDEQARSAYASAASAASAAASASAYYASSSAAAASSSAAAAAATPASAYYAAAASSSAAAAAANRAGVTAETLAAAVRSIFPNPPKGA